MFGMIPWRRKEIRSGNLPSVQDFRREFDDFMDRFLGDVRSRPEGFFTREFAPAFDISETDEEIIVKAELPGVDPKEVDISLTGNMLTVRGEKREQHEEKGENVYRVERTFGSFSRTFPLPCEVREDQITATYKDGVLDLRLPKSETAKKKSIKIAMH